MSLEDLDSVFERSPWEVMAHNRARERHHRRQRSGPIESIEQLEDIEMTVTNVPSNSPVIEKRDCVWQG